MKLDPNEASALAAIVGTVVNAVAAFFALLSAKAARKAAEATQKSAENDLLPYTEKFRGGKAGHSPINRLYYD